MVGIYFLAGLVLSSASSPTTVYDNTTTYLRMGQPMLSTLRNDGAEMGDEVILAKSEREVVELRLRFWYYGTDAATCDAVVRFRSLLKDKVITGPARYENGKIAGYVNTPCPGPAFYEGKLVKGLKIEPGINEYRFQIPHVRVQDRFVWTVQALHGKGITAGFGPAYYNPPATGSSDDFFWHSDMGSPWIAYSWGREPYCNFGARILAVSTH